MTLRRSFLRALAAGLLLAPAALAQTTYTVTNTNSTGAGSLRQAVTDANANPGHDLIHFDIDGTPPHTIVVGNLPVVTDPVTIDATTQPGYSGAPVVALALEGFGNWAVRFDAGSEGSVLRGLSIYKGEGHGGGFTAAVGIWNTSDVAVESSWLGLKPDGVAQGCDYGVQINNGSGNRIGGPDPEDRVVASGNASSGIWIVSDPGNASADNVIENVYAGTDPGGTEARPNGDTGIELGNFSVTGTVIRNSVISGNAFQGLAVTDDATGTWIVGNRVGTTADGTAALPNGWIGVDLGAADAVVEDNVISGNASTGLKVDADGAVVRDNWIGTDGTGTTAIPNGLEGVWVAGTVDAQILNNVVSGNAGAGILLGGSGHVVQGNRIGVDASGQALLPNAGAQLAIGDGAHDNLIGGTESGQGNLVGVPQPSRGEPGRTITLSQSAGDGNTIQSPDGELSYNVGLFLAGLFIDLGEDGPTPNDPGDADDDLPNKGMNSPEILSVVDNSDGTLTIQLTLDSDPANQVYPVKVDIYARIPGMTEMFVRDKLFTVMLTADDYDGCGNPPCVKEVTFTSPIVIGLIHDVTATATDDEGNTSEPGNFVDLTSSGGPLVVTNTDDSGAGSLRQAIDDANANPGRDEIRFDIPGTPPFVIHPFSNLPGFVEPVDVVGSSQPGFGGHPVVYVAADGTTHYGFQFGPGSEGSTFEGLGVFQAPTHTDDAEACIEIDGASGITVQNAVVGLNADGAEQGCGVGVRVTDSGGNLFGGPTEDDEVVVAGNLFEGVEVEGAEAPAEGNVFDHVEARNNGGAGISAGVDGTFPVTVQITNSLFSGNGGPGVRLGDGADGSSIGGAIIGLDADGTAALGNGSDGVVIDATGVSVTNSTIGGNAGVGVRVQASGVTVEDCRIGTDPAGLVPFGNLVGGVTVAVADFDGENDEVVLRGNTVAGNESHGMLFGPFDPGFTGGVRVQANEVGVTPGGGLLLNNGIQVFIEDGAVDIQFGGTGPGEGNVVGVPPLGPDGEGQAIVSGPLSGPVTIQAAPGEPLAALSTGDPGVASSTIDKGGDGHTAESAPRFGYLKRGAKETLSGQYDSDEPGQTALFLLRLIEQRAGGALYQLVTIGYDTYTEEDYSGCGDPPCPKEFTFTPAVPVEVGDLVFATIADEDGDTSELSFPVEVEDATGGPDLTFSATASPTDFPSSGGTLTFAFTLTSNEPEPLDLDLWIEASGPATYRKRVASGTLAAGATVSRQFRVRVRPDALDGAYDVALHVGAFPDTPYASEVFTMTKGDGARVATRTAARGAATRGEPLFGEVTLDGDGALFAVVPDESEAAAPETAAPEAASSAAPTAEPVTVRPNPFAQRALLRFALAEAADVRLAVYDVLGREVAVLVDARLEAGAHAAALDARGLASGTYLWRFVAGDRVETGRLTLTR